MANEMTGSTRPFSQLTAFGGVSWDTVVTVPALLGADDKTWGRVVGQFPGGMGANVAATYAGLGGQARLVSAVGLDEVGTKSLKALERFKVDTRLVARRPGSTFETLSMIDVTGEKAMLLIENADLVTPGDLAIDQPRPGIDGIHVAPSRYAPSLEKLADWRSKGIHVSVDIEPSMIQRGLDFRACLSGATVVFCGERASKMMATGETTKSRMAEMLDAGSDVIVVTRGRHGAMAMTRGGAVFERAGASVKAVNTAGAGDAFAGTFLFGLSQGWPIDLALAAANHIGAKCVEGYGSQCADLSVRSLDDLPELSNHLSSARSKE